MGLNQKFSESFPIHLCDQVLRDINVNLKLSPLPSREHVWIVLI